MKTPLSEQNSKNHRRRHGFSVWIVLALLSICERAWASYDYTPVILHLSADKQPDSLGFNLVRSFPKLVYREILEGRVKLYNNAAKEVQITPSNLIRLEQENKLQFDQIQDLFFNEVWKYYHRNFEFQVIGFSFFARTPAQKLLNFGFVDANEIRRLLENRYAETDLNGPDSLTYWQAICSKAFSFQVVKFGNKDFEKKPELAIKLRKQALCAKTRKNTYPISRRKFVNSVMYPSKDEQLDNFRICSSLESYYRKNPQVVFRHIQVGPEYKNREYPMTLTRIELQETWFWQEGKVHRRTDKILPYINGVAMDSLNWTELQRLNLMVNFRPLAELFEDGNFTFNIAQVNSSPIRLEDQPIVQNALIMGNWTRIKLKSKNKN